LAVLYANGHRDEKVRPQPYTIWDFLAHEEEPPITMEQAMETWQ
jgi:hypothetical protein